MGIKTQIHGNGPNIADVFSGYRKARSKPRGLVSYTYPYELEINAPTYAANPTYGNAMNVNGTSSGSSDGIHDGTDSVLWTASALSGTWTFNSTAQAFAGTRSIDATSTVDADTALFTRSSAISATTYNTFEGAIYISSWSGSGTKGVNLQFRLAGVTVGSTVDLGSYINTNNTGVWQGFSIPLSAFGLSGNVDELTVATVDVGAGPPPDYYLDSLKFQATTAGTGPQVYTIQPDQDEILRVYGIATTLVDNYTLATSTGGAKGLSYNKFGSLNALTNGILVRRIQEDTTLFTNSISTHADIITGPGGELRDLWYDGTNVYTKFYVRFAQPVELNGQERDRYEFTVRDNLSSLVGLDIRADAARVTKQNGSQLK